jgi:hypothetical protein
MIWLFVSISLVAVAVTSHYYSTPHVHSTFAQIRWNSSHTDNTVGRIIAFALFCGSFLTVLLVCAATAVCRCIGSACPVAF